MMCKQIMKSNMHAYTVAIWSFIFHKKSGCFLHIAASISRKWSIWIVIWHINVIQVFQPFWNSINSVQKVVDLTIPAKNRRKMRMVGLNFQIKKMISLMRSVVWNWPFKSTTQSLIFVKCKYPNRYSVPRSKNESFTLTSAIR